MMRRIRNKIKKILMPPLAYLLSLLTLQKPVERDRWLFGRSGFGMIIFAIVIAIVVPAVILVGIEIQHKINGSDVNEMLLGNYDTDVTKFSGSIKKDSIILDAESISNHHGHAWSVLSQYTDPGNLPAAKEGSGYFWALLCAIAGIFCLSGFAVSSLVSFITRVSERWKRGLLTYDVMFKKYVVIIGVNEQTPAIIRRSLLERDGVDYVLIQTRRDVEKARMDIELKLDEDLEKKVVFYAGERTSAEDIGKLRLENAVEVFVLGESISQENEEDHDAFNINCLEHISTYISDWKKSHKEFNRRLRAHVNFEYQSTFTAFKATHLYQKLDRDIEFVPFNVHEIWAKKVLVDSFAVIPSGKKGEVKVQHYFPIDTYVGADGKRKGISPETDKRVHLVVLGMNQMGTALATQAALMCHFPNYTADNRLRTTITLIDDHAKVEADYYTGRFSSLFELCRHRTIICKDEALKYDPNWEAADNKWERYNYLRSKDERVDSFLDIQFEFIQGNIADTVVKQYLIDIASDTQNITTVAICFNNPQQSLASAMYLPVEIYDQVNQVLVYQQNSFDIVHDVTGGDTVWKRYPNLFPFGMIESSYTENPFDNHLAKIHNYLYVKFNKIRTQIETGESDMDSLLKIDKRLLYKIDAYWDQLGIVQKLSNIDAVESISMKIRSLGVDPNSGNIQYIEDNIANKPKAVEKIAEAEHLRWVVERLIMGFRCLTKQEQTEMLRLRESKTIEKRLKIDQERAHLDICSNKRLKEVDGDVGHHDIQFVTNMPKMLKYREWVAILRLANDRYKNSQHAKIAKIFFGEGGKLHFNYIDGDNLLVKSADDRCSHSFWMEDYPVTCEQWDYVMGTNLRRSTGRKKPVTKKSKVEIDDFLLVLRKKSGLCFCLPSSKEWKYAALMSNSYLYDEDDNVREENLGLYLWINKKKSEALCDVDKHTNHKKVKYGLYHMLGYVWEWTRTEDEDHENYSFLCGGSWRFKFHECDIFQTDENKQYWKASWSNHLKSEDLGFRLVWRFDQKGYGGDNVKTILEEYESDTNLHANANTQGMTPWQKKQIDILENMMIDVEKGYFIMGADGDYDLDADSNEQPIHIVRISKSFKISSKPVTQALWNAVMGNQAKDNPSKAKIGDELPQTNVSWSTVMNFITRLNEMTGKNYRLPSEAEWEYAAKGGHMSQLSSLSLDELKKLEKDMNSRAKNPHIPEPMHYPLFSGSEVAEEVAWFNVRSIQPSGKKKPNELGLYDMSGNIWEWCLDFYQSDIYNDCINGAYNNEYIQLSPYQDEYKDNGYISDPIGIDTDYAAHVFRGGSYASEKKDCRCTRANFWSAEYESEDLGFRLVLDGAIDMNEFENRQNNGL